MRIVPGRQIFPLPKTTGLVAQAHLLYRSPTAVQRGETGLEREDELSKDAAHRPSQILLILPAILSTVVSDEIPGSGPRKYG